jgi:hypothetical protein
MTRGLQESYSRFPDLAADAKALGLYVDCHSSVRYDEAVVSRNSRTVAVFQKNRREGAVWEKVYGFREAEK